MLTIFGAVAELERELYFKGKYKGRKRIESPEFDRVVSRWRIGEITAIKAMEMLHMKRSTFYREIKEN